MEASYKSNIMELLSFVADRTMHLARENSVLGECIEKENLTVIPISKISVSFAGGGADSSDERRKRQQHPAGGGAKVSHIPVSCLVIKDGDVRIMGIHTPEGSNNSNFASSIFKMLKSKKTEE